MGNQRFDVLESKIIIQNQQWLIWKNKYYNQILFKNIFLILWYSRFWSLIYSRRVYLPRPQSWFSIYFFLNKDLNCKFFFPKTIFSIILSEMVKKSQIFIRCQPTIKKTRPINHKTNKYINPLTIYRFNLCSLFLSRITITSTFSVAAESAAAWKRHMGALAPVASWTSDDDLLLKNAIEVAPLLIFLYLLYFFCCGLIYIHVWVIFDFDFRPVDELSTVDIWIPNWVDHVMYFFV